MSTMLLIMAGYIAMDRLMTIGSVGKKIDITPAFAVLSVLTGAFFVYVLTRAALGGVAP